MTSSPTEVFWHVVDNAGVLPWWFKALCAVAGIVAVYRLERHWEHIPLFFGLLLIAVSPLWTPAGPFGDWLVYPSLVIALWRHAAHRCGTTQGERRSPAPCCDHDALLALDRRIRADTRASMSEARVQGPSRRFR